MLIRILNPLKLLLEMKHVLLKVNLSQYNVMTPKILTTSNIIDIFPQEWILQYVVKYEKV